MPKPVRCPECKWEYPENILNSMFINSSHTPPICGICALEINNKFHGINRKKWDGPVAEHMRQLALRWRKRNPNRAPVNVGTTH